MSNAPVVKEVVKPIKKVAAKTGIVKAPKPAAPKPAAPAPAAVKASPAAAAVAEPAEQATAAKSEAVQDSGEQRKRRAAAMRSRARGRGYRSLLSPAREESGVTTLSGL